MSTISYWIEKSPVGLFRILLTFFLLIAQGYASSFDLPQSKKIVDLGPSPYSFHEHSEIHCFYYSTFMVKQVDFRQKGAESLSIVPRTDGNAPDCSRDQTSNEIVIDRNEIGADYFMGVKGDLVFFHAADGLNGSLGFVIHDSKTGRKIFEDYIVGKLRFSEVPGSPLSLRYMKVLESECVLPNDPVTCWAQIKTTIGLEKAALPNCKKFYDREVRGMTRGSCNKFQDRRPQCPAEVRDLIYSTVSAVAYPVEVTLSPQPRIKPVPGKLRCWPVD